ncbi:MAG: OmpH family outer membrane protein [Bacteroidaceae bacterium]|nr:OmpH family outer membrane protein [Bacteroidaceae bacterium]
MKKIIFAALLMLAPLTIFAQQKFGHFSMADIVPSMPEYTTAQSELQKLGEQYEADIKRMQDEFQKKYEEYQKEQANLLDNVRQRREAELQDLSQRIQQSAQDNQQAFEKARTEKLQVIYEKVNTAVKKIGDEGNYVYIMDTSAGIPYISTKLSTDVTADLKRALGI